MIYGSVCSGIEAASAAWHPLGWRAAFLSEIEAFPRAVLAHHYPHTPLHGDFTTIREGNYAAIDVLVGGTPCQSFSVAGLRAGLDDERGNLALEFCRLARRLGPRWVVWENVPGVLSLDGGRAFASILGGLAECGYGLAYRVLDAQFVRVDGFGRAVPQRRRRVFVVGHLGGNWQRAAAVLFERASMQGNLAPRREARERAALTLAARTRGGGGLGTDFDCDGELIHFQGQGTNLEFGGDVAGTLATGIDRASGAAPCIAHTLNAAGGVGRLDYESETLLPVDGGSFDVAHALRAEGFDASEDGTGRGTPLVPVQGVALRGRDGGSTAELTGDVMTALRTGGGGGDKPHVLMPVAFSSKDYGNDAMSGVTPTLRAMGHSKSHANAGGQLAIAYAIQERAVSENLDNGPQGAGIQADHAYTLEARNKVQAVCFDETQVTSKTNRSQPRAGDPSHPLAAGARAPTIAFNARQDPDCGPVTHPLDTDGSTIGIFSNWRVRRLTPTECERLQGFPDGYTNVPYRRRNWTPDGPRYKALGNSMAVNVMRWIGRRIEMVEKIK